MMIQGSINIDDAGNPGADSGSEFLSETRKSWTAVIIPSSVARDVSTEMDSAAARLEENMVAFVMAITLQHENCRPISDRDQKAIAEISKMLDAKQVKTDYNFFNALRDPGLCISK